MSSLAEITENNRPFNMVMLESDRLLKPKLQTVALGFIKRHLWLL